MFNKNRFNKKMALSVSGLALSFLLGAAAAAEELRMEVTLTGEDQVPAVETEGHGSGTIEVDAARKISGSVTTENVPGTMAHIHEAPPGENGPVVVPLEQDGDNTWVVPEGVHLTEAQLETLKEGNLYINVHTEENPGGEVRGQLNP